MSPTKKLFEILLVDDDLPTLKLLNTILEGEPYRIRLAESGELAFSALSEQVFDVIVSDIQLGDKNGLELLTYVKEHHPNTLVILVTAQGEVDTAVKSLQLGAFDYLTKSSDLNEMTEELRSLVKRAAMQVQASRHRSSGSAAAKSTEKGKQLLGRSPAMGRIFRAIAKAAMSESTVLIVGESGTGKELVASAIHQNSKRAGRPFVTLNCGALTETLLESELFGHTKGSFTGAGANRRGLFEEADGGTIFLDEIGDISQPLQIRLLRVLQEGEFKPVGANEVRRVDVRVIAATHRNLPKLIADGQFRQDLFYRLKVIPIDLAPLRERKQDIPELVEHFLALHSARNGKPLLKVSKEAMRLLCDYGWPGNVRELENAIERAVAMSNGDVLFPEDFSEEVPRDMVPAKTAGELPVDTAELDSSEVLAPHPLDEVEREHILKTLKQVRFNKSKAAQLLGIDRVTLYRKVLRYAIPTGESEKRSPVTS